MVLSGQTIKNLIQKNKLKIDPYQETAVRFVSVDLHLGDTAVNPDSGEHRKLEDYHLSIDEFMLSNTQETVSLPNNLMARVIPRSSIARLGVLVTFDSDLLPPNYVGKPVLTIKNLSKRPILLSAKLPICQLLFEEVDKPVKGYRSSYKHTKPEISKLENKVKSKNKEDESKD